jgi:hypothetical protein
MKDLDGQVVALLPEDVLGFPLEYLSSAVMRVDDVITDLVVDVLGLPGDLKLLVLVNGRFGSDDVLLVRAVNVLGL